MAPAIKRLRIAAAVVSLGLVLGVTAVYADDPEPGTCNFTCPNTCGVVASGCSACDFDEPNCTYTFGPCTSVTWKNNSKCPNTKPDGSGVYKSSDPIPPDGFVD